MLCKNCGKELPVTGKFCPFCGAPVEQTDVSDETMLFTPIDDENAAPIDLSAFDAVLREDKGITPPSAPGTQRSTLSPDQMPPIETPRVQRTANTAPSAPRTTYFDAADPTDRPYKKPSTGKKAGVVVLVIVLIAALIGGGVWFFRSRQPDETLTLAERYMERGKFSDALEAYQTALTDAKDPAAIQLQIDQLTDYLAAEDLVSGGDYVSALARLQSLRDRISDKTSPLGEAVDALIEQANAGQSDSAFAEDLSRAQEYLSNEQLDQAAGLLDTLAGDAELTSDQLRQVEKLQDQLKQAQEAAQRQQETQEQKTQQKQSFIDRMDALEENDTKILQSDTPEQELELTQTSFESWDTLLSDMYDYLATILNADQYATEEESYNQWVKDRDAGALSAAGESEVELDSQLAEASFKQSYTKTRCYRILDLM